MPEVILIQRAPPLSMCGSGGDLGAWEASEGIRGSPSSQSPDGCSRTQSCGRSWEGWPEEGLEVPESTVLGAFYVPDTGNATVSTESGPRPQAPWASGRCPSKQIFMVLCPGARVGARKTSWRRDSPLNLVLNKYWASFNPAQPMRLRSCHFGLSLL